jgi:hypothetical protein
MDQGKKLTTNAGAPVADNQQLLYANTARAIGGHRRKFSSVTSATA